MVSAALKRPSRFRMRRRRTRHRVVTLRTEGGGIISGAVDFDRGVFHFNMASDAVQMVPDEVQTVSDEVNMTSASLYTASDELGMASDELKMVSNTLNMAPDEVKV